MPPPDPNNTYIQPPSEIQILKFIKTLGYDEDPETKLIFVSKMVATRLQQPWRAILSVLNRCLMGKDSSLDTDEFEWKTVERSSRPSKMSKLLYTRFTNLIIDYLLSLNKSIPRRSDSKLHIPDAIISDAIKKKERYKYYMDKEVETNVPNKLRKDVMPRKTRSLTISEETVVGELAHFISIEEPRSQQRRRSRLTIDRQTDEAIANMYNEWGQKLKGPTVKDPVVQSMLDLRKGSKANKLKSLRQKKQPVARDYAAARYGVFMHNKSTATPNSTYLGSTVTSSSLDFIQTLLDETPANELTDFISHPVCSSNKNFNARNVPRRECSSYSISTSKENSLSYNISLTKLTTSQSKEADAKGKKEYEEVQLQEGNQDALDAQAVQSSFHKRSHNNHDPPKNRKGDNKKKCQKDVNESSSRSSRQNRPPVVIVQDDTHAMQPLDQADIHIDKDENHILGPSTVAIAKKFKELI
ncbi:hypothetical protein Tco_1343779 [Tanacetum coccineum]